MTNSLSSFYRGKKIFLTGHTGFKGCWLMLWLKQLGAEVTGYALPPEIDSLYTLIKGDTHCRSVIGDISDVKKLHTALNNSGAEIVIHMAAQALVRPSYADPVGTFQTNIMGSIYLLEAARKTPTKIKALVNVTTDKCYANDGSGTLFKENDALGGHDPYSSSKAASEIVTAAYRQSFLAAADVHVATARAGNVIGGGDFSVDRIIPDIIRAMEKGESAVIRSPNAVRPWQHVLDADRGYLLLAQKLYEEGEAFAKAYNFGPSSEFLTVKELADRLIDCAGRGEYTIDPARANLHEAPMLRLDAALAEKELGWKPVFNADGAIGFTADWYKEYLAKSKNMTDYSFAHIEQYMRML